MVALLLSFLVWASWTKCGGVCTTAGLLHGGEDYRTAQLLLHAGALASFQLSWEDSTQVGLPEVHVYGVHACTCTCVCMYTYICVHGMCASIVEVEAELIEVGDSQIFEFISCWVFRGVHWLGEAAGGSSTLTPFRAEAPITATGIGCTSCLFAEVLLELELSASFAGTPSPL